MKEGEIFCIAKDDARYPTMLRHIPDAPASIYIRGSLEALARPALAVIGSRKQTAYGLQVVKTLIPPIAEHFVICSGLAIGTDGSAHRHALEAKRLTVAVLGSGIDDDSIYPASHFSLAHDILRSGGCLISEYAPGTRARPEYFPARNRMIAGLSQGVIITEAAHASGTMITARLALDYGRDVFAVPGSVFSALSAGTNELLRQGAHVVVRPEDVLRLYGIETHAQQDLLLSPHEEHIYKHIMREACSVDALLEITKLTVGDLMQTLAQLELRKLVYRNAHLYAATRPAQ